MIRVLHILDHSLPLHSGYAFRTRALLKAEMALGIAVRGITGPRHGAGGPGAAEPDPEVIDPEVIEGLTFHRTPAPPGEGLLGVWREIARFRHAIAALCAAWPPDVLHAHSPALCGMAALGVARRRKLPLVYEIRGFWEDAAVANGTSRAGSPRYRLTRALESHVAARADRVVTIAAGLRDDLVARGLAPARIVPNGVDLTLFGQSPPRDAELAAALGLSAGPVIGFIGSFYDYEGLDGLIAAMPMLLARVPSARLLLVGGGPCEAVWRALAAASPAAHAIRLIGRVPHDAVPRYYALCDIMAYPRKASRLTELVTPLKPLEAMAQGKLVAASDVGGHRELIPRDDIGTLFAPDDPRACAEALASLIESRVQWPARQAAARRMSRRHYDWARHGEAYRDLYDELLEKRRQPENQNLPGGFARIA